MIKGREKGIVFLIAIIAGLTVASAAPFMNICLREGETIYFSECNPTMDDYTCESDECLLCVNEVSRGVYCSASPQSCQDACFYLYNEQESGEESVEITLLSPDEEESVEERSVDFTFNLNNPGMLERCDLYLNQKRKKYTSSPSEENTLKAKNLKQGIYEWHIECKEKIAYGSEIIVSESRTLYIGYSEKNHQTVPEFSLLVGILTAVGAIGIFFFARRS